MLKWYYLYRVKLRKKKKIFFFPFPCLETTPSLTVLSRLVLFIYLFTGPIRSSAPSEAGTMGRHHHGPTSFYFLKCVHRVI